MSSAPKTAAEPSMEDILASIRRIIADEGGADEEPQPFDASAQEDADTLAEAVAEEPEIEPAGEEMPEVSDQSAVDDLFADGGGFDAMDAVDDTEDAVDDTEDAIDDAEDNVDIPVVDPAEDVLELTDDMMAPVEDKPDLIAPTEAEPDVVFDEVDTPALDMPEDEATDAFEVSEPVSPPPPTLEQRLMSDATDSAVNQAFGKLANTLLLRDARTIEDVITEMLRPMLREWIDDNLPHIVERLVREEIERVSRGR